jgi:hypothetical protein
MRLESMKVDFTIGQTEGALSCRLDHCPLCDTADQTGLTQVELAHHGLSALCHSLIHALNPDLAVKVPAKPSMDQIFAVSMSSIDIAAD